MSEAKFLSYRDEQRLDFVSQSTRGTLVKIKKRPKPPRGLRFNNGVLQWETPADSPQITHYRVYANVESNQVRQIPAWQLYLDDNLKADRVFVSAYNSDSDLESIKVLLNTAIAPLADCLFPVDFGAVGDGVADDTAAWTLAIARAIVTGRPICGGGLTYLVSKQAAQALSSPYNSGTHGYVFKPSAAVSIYGPAEFVVSITDANVTNVFLFVGINGARLSNLSFTGTGTATTQILYSGAAIVFDTCTDCEVSDIQTSAMRGNTLFFNSTNGGAFNSFSKIPTTNKAGSHFASFSSSHITFRDCSGYGGTTDGDIIHFGSPATGNRTLNCKLYNYAFGDATKAIVFNEAQGFLLDSGQDFGVISECYGYGYYYGIDIKTTGEGLLATRNTLEKCKIGVAVRRGEGNAPSYNTKVTENIIRPLGGNGNAVTLAGGRTATVGIYFQDSPGLTISDNLIEASYLFGAGEQDFISIVGTLSDASFVSTQLDGPWITGNRFMQVMNIGGAYTYSKNAAVYITGTSVALLKRGCINDNDFNVWVDTPITYYPLSLTYLRQFAIRGNHFGNEISPYQQISITNGDSVSILDNTFDTSPGFLKLENINRLIIQGNIFRNEVRNSTTALPVAAIFFTTVTNAIVSGNIQQQDAAGGSDDGFFLETSSSGNSNIVLLGNNLTKKLFLPHWYSINGVDSNSSQDISVVGNILNGRLSIGSVVSARTWAVRSSGGNWIVDGATGPALAAATTQTIDLGNYASADGLGQMPAYSKILSVNIKAIDGFAGTGFTSVTVRLSDSTGGVGAYTSIPVPVTTTGAFQDFLPINPSILQTATNLQVTITANQNFTANALTGAFTITVQWIKITVPNFTV